MISDKAVEAAFNALSDQIATHTQPFHVRAALEAALPHLLDREKVARVIYYVHGEGVTVESALGEKNDVHWNHWKDQSDADDAWRAADAILAHPQKGG